MQKTTFYGWQLSCSNPSLSGSLEKEFVRIFFFTLTFCFFGMFATGVHAQTQTQTFNSSGTFTVPAGVTTVTVEAWGGGGRGATRTLFQGAGGAGGGGAYARKVIAVSPGSYIVTVGAGSTSAAAGGDSWFSSASTVMAKGGASGSGTTGGAGGSAAASIGDVKFNGGNGSNSGGGGSSAGTAAAGNNGSGGTGATAPAGGGNGGGTLVAGSAPGGGGGSGAFSIGPGAGGNGRVSVTYDAPAPIISQHPQPANLAVGQTIDLSVTATLTDSYQWKRNGVIIPGATGPSFSKSDITTADAGNYSVDVTNIFFTVSSNAAAIVVHAMPTAAPSPSASPICEGGSVNLSSGGALNSTATRTLLNENFNDAANGWKTINNSTGGTVANAAWTLRGAAYLYIDPDFNFIFFISNDLSQCYISNSQSQGGGTTATILQSPGVNTMGMGTAALSYYQYYKGDGPGTTRVEASIDGTSWTTLSTTTTTQGSAAGFVLSTVSLNAYVNQPTVYVRFKYDGANDYYWAIDNVTVTGTMSAAPVYAWTSDPPGFTSSLANPTLVFPDGNTTYYCNVTNHYGFAASGSTSVQVNPYETFYADTDGDTYGDTNVEQQSCFGAPPGHVADGTDCNDSDPAMHTEFEFYSDTDGDGYGDGAAGLNEACAVNATTPPAGYSLDDTDCNDQVAGAHPGAAEIGYNLIDDDCDGSVDEGFPPKVTVLQGAMCNTVLQYIDSQLMANIVAGAQGYRWRITTMTGPTTGQVQELDTPIRVMKITQLATYAFNTTYQVEVGVYYAGFLQPYAVSNCTVTTPATTTQLTSCETGLALTNLHDPIYAEIVPYASGYRFRITDPLDPLNPDVLDRAIRVFRISDVAEFQVQYGKTYNVECAVRNTDGSYLPFGQVCSVGTPLFPTTSVQDAQCDDGTGLPYLVPDYTTPIVANSFPGAIAYAFRLVGDGLPPGGIVAVRNTRTCTLGNFAGMGIQPGMTYNISVRLIFDWADVDGPYGKVCTLTVPGTAREMQSSDKFDVIVDRNPFADSFGFVAAGLSDLPVAVRLYDMTGRLLEEAIVKTAGIESLRLGGRYPSGVYNLILKQGDDIKMLRVIKR